jgi:hypothetical protein
MLNFKFSPVKGAISDIGSAIALSRIEFNGGNPAAQVINRTVSVKIIPTTYRLLQNYPNPFNPETWIPFELPQEASVAIKVYDMSGRLVRSLSLGKKLAGSYLTRTQAAYWDGRNELGERVVSGVYYYQLQAGTYSAIKKMVILK